MGIFDKWLGKQTKVNTVTIPNTVVSASNAGQQFSTVTWGAPITSAPSPIYAPLTGQVSGAGYTGYANANYITAAGPGRLGTTNMGPAHHIIQFNNQGNEIVRLNTDGSVTWTNGINVDEAAEAFARSISLGAELSSGITGKVKRDMRDSVFEDIIAIAKEKGSLTAEDLTYMLQASKIMEKLKGGKE